MDFGYLLLVIVSMTTVRIAASVRQIDKCTSLRDLHQVAVVTRIIFNILLRTIYSVSFVFLNCETVCGAFEELVLSGKIKIFLESKRRAGYLKVHQAAFFLVVELSLTLHIGYSQPKLNCLCDSCGLHLSRPFQNHTRWRLFTEEHSLKWIPIHLWKFCVGVLNNGELLVELGSSL